MTALILKDIATLKKTLLLTITICIALAVYGIYENAIFMIPLICAMIPLILTAIALVASVLMSAIQLPFILKYGAEKGRLIMVITYFAIFALSTFLKEKSDLLANMVELFSKYSMVMIFIGIVLVGLVIIGIAIKISISIMDKKEY